MTVRQIGGTTCWLGRGHESPRVSCFHLFNLHYEEGGVLVVVDDDPYIYHPLVEDDRSVGGESWG